MPDGASPLNLLQHPSRNEIAGRLDKHKVHLDKNIIIPGNDLSEYDKVVSEILSVISNDRFTTYDDVVNKEINYFKLAEKGLVRDLDGKITYDISQLKSAISEPNLGKSSIDPFFGRIKKYFR